jgi:hypothetical protein
VNTIAHHADAKPRARAVLLNQLTFVGGECDDSVRSFDQIRLDLPLRETLRWTLANFVLRSIKRVDGVDERYVELIANRERNVREPEDMKMDDVWSPRYGKGDGIQDRRYVRGSLDSDIIAAYRD